MKTAENASKTECLCSGRREGYASKVKNVDRDQHSLWTHDLGVESVDWVGISEPHTLYPPVVVDAAISRGAAVLETLEGTSQNLRMLV